MTRSKEDDRERKRLYRQQHPDRVASSQRKNYTAKREQRLVQKHEYYERNKERIKEYQRNYRVANADKLDAQRRRYREKHKAVLASRAMHKKTGLTAILKRELMEAQGNQCAICQVDFATLPSRHIHSDHCHMTKQPRGVLCGSCNLGLGKFKDDPELLQRAAAYLRKEAGLCPIPQH